MIATVENIVYYNNTEINRLNNFEGYSFGKVWQNREFVISYVLVVTLFVYTIVSRG